MASDNQPTGQRSSMGAPHRKGGLGRGLGALIPSVQAEENVSRERPLDVLFPDLRGGGADNSGRASSAEGKERVRGGSARDLLTPKQGSGRRNVSRETISRLDAAGRDAGRRTSVLNEGTTESTPTDVSRETISDETIDFVEVPGTTFGMLELASIIPNTKQPRQIFEQSELEELADSLKEVGLLQPIVVRPIDVENPPTPALVEALESNPGAQYELIMGERRLRAAKLAGLETIPALVRELDDENLLRDALLENLHRAQLNPLEEAAAYSQLMEDFDCTQEELSRRIARSRPQIANTIRLLKLPPTVQRRVAAGLISAGHARALLALPDGEGMAALGERIINEGLSVRATEEIVRIIREGDGPSEKERRSRTQTQLSPLALHVADQVAEYLDTQVTVSEGKSRGKLVITFADQADLQRIADLLAGH